MARQKTVFVCQQCGTESPKWMGKCSGCGEWNSLVETMVAVSRGDRSAAAAGKEAVLPQPLSKIKSIRRDRLQTRIEELDRVLGGGVVPGSMVLVAGEPGIGKSTLMLQLAAAASIESRSFNRESKPKRLANSVLYVSGEESLQQLKLRAERLGIKSDNLLFLSEINVDAILSTIRQFNNQQSGSLTAVIIDSIQTLYTEDLAGTAGSVGQVREGAGRLLKAAKSLNIPVFLVGHVTKSGSIAGPKVLEHLVDTVLYFEGERFSAARLLRATKNRFGATDEVGIFEMQANGLAGVINPSKLFLKQRVQKVPGSAVAVAMEGTRPVLAEIQALVVPTQLPIPRRVGQGVDYNRLQMITAILTKRLGLPLGGSDIFVNVAGGLQIKEPAADLGIALAIVSSFKNMALDLKLACFGEVGLLGELREVNQPEKRAKEARRLGFTSIVSPEKYGSIGQVARQLLAKK